MLSSSDHVKVNQVLRLKVEGRSYKGLIVNMSEDSMLVATTSQEDPAVPAGTTVQGELFKEDGLYHFTTRLVGFQLMPVLVFIVDRPKVIRRIQRRREPRHPVQLTAHLIFISADRSINAEVEVSNLSFGGMELQAPSAPPLGMHCVVLLKHGMRQLSTICLVVHVDGNEEGYKLGLSFVEMSRRDLEALHNFVSELDDENR